MSRKGTQREKFLKTTILILKTTYFSFHKYSIDSLYINAFFEIMWYVLLRQHPRHFTKTMLEH